MFIKKKECCHSILSIPPQVFNITLFCSEIKYLIRFWKRGAEVDPYRCNSSTQKNPLSSNDTEILRLFKISF